MSKEHMKRKISVFIASPGDLIDERNAFKDTVDELNGGFGDGAEIEFEALGWENSFASTGPRNQSVINTMIDRCDVFILVMNRRWGQEAPDATPYSSYTEEEFHRALCLFKQNSKPEIFVFFKEIDSASEADAGPQLSKVLEFKRHLENTRSVLYKTFKNTEEFKILTNSHLRAFSKGDLPKLQDNSNALILPLDIIAEIENQKHHAQIAMDEAKKLNDENQILRRRYEVLQLQTAIDASNLSKDGKIAFARQRFSELMESSEDLKILLLCSDFFERTGDYESAIRALNKWIAYNSDHLNNLDAADIYLNLGHIKMLQGDYNEAQEYFSTALSIGESHNCPEITSASFGNIGILKQYLGDFTGAESNFKKSLEIEITLNREINICGGYINLGVMYFNQKKFSDAEESIANSLEIAKRHGYKECIAACNTNLGKIHLTSERFLEAERCFLNALDIEIELDHKQGISTDYGNMATLFNAQGKHEDAIKYLEKALIIDKKIGDKYGIAVHSQQIGNTYLLLNRPDLSKEHLETSISFFRYINNTYGIESCLDTLNLTYISTGEEISAAKSLFELIQLKKHKTQPDKLIELQNNLSQLYITQKKFSEAKALLDNSTEIASTSTPDADRAKTYAIYGMLFSAKGDYEESDSYFKKSLKLFPTRLAIENYKILSNKIGCLGNQKKKSEMDILINTYESKLIK